MPTLFLKNTMKVIHDFSVNNFPELYSKNYLKYHDGLLWYAKKFDKAIAYISKATINDLNKFHKINSQNKNLVYLPNGIPFKVKNYDRPKEENTQLKYQNKNLEFLVVGRINKHKGFDRILEFCKYFDNTEDIKYFNSVTLNIVGKQTPETTQLFKDMNLENINLIFHGFLNDKELNNLYTKSHYCLFLSRNEGYGIPLVEAMWFNSMPIISNIPIFNEIMGSKYPKFDEKTGYTEAICQFVLKNFKDIKYRNMQKAILENIVSNESCGYKNSAKNLIKYTESI
jgi:glycosyltransferase involved in cell wall biosynthesis